MNRVTPQLARKRLDEMGEKHKESKVYKDLVERL